MRFRVINIVDSVAQINYGIWNAATSTAPALRQNHDVESHLWYPADTADGFDCPPAVTPMALPDRRLTHLKSLISTLDPRQDIIITHGAWQYPTRWGAYLARKGFVWVYVPHGMLEPWSMRHKAFKKWLYYHLRERPLARRARALRAVGKPERQNLRRQFREVVLIPNGFTIDSAHQLPPDTRDQGQRPYRVVFLSRLHPKKRVAELARAWASSTWGQNRNVELLIAGPDEGEQPAILQAIEGVRNARIVGPVYGEQRDILLSSAHFFILPSLSEGFPTSVVEAMALGAVPLISTGCNFPEAFAAHLAIDTGTETTSIIGAFNKVLNLDRAEWRQLSSRARLFALGRYSAEAVARHQSYWYFNLLSKNI